jgi:hypothetical protein
MIAVSKSLLSAFSLAGRLRRQDRDTITILPLQDERSLLTRGTHLLPHSAAVMVGPRSLGGIAVLDSVRLCSRVERPVLCALHLRSAGCCDVSLTRLENLAAPCASRFRPNANLFALLPLQRQTGGETVTASECVI